MEDSIIESPTASVEAVVSLGIRRESGTGHRRTATAPGGQSRLVPERRRRPCCRTSRPRRGGPRHAERRLRWAAEGTGGRPMNGQRLDRGEPDTHILAPSPLPPSLLALPVAVALSGGLSQTIRCPGPSSGLHVPRRPSPRRSRRSAATTFACRASTSRTGRWTRPPLAAAAARSSRLPRSSSGRHRASTVRRRGRRPRRRPGGAGLCPPSPPRPARATTTERRTRCRN